MKRINVFPAFKKCTISRRGSFNIPSALGFSLGGFEEYCVAVFEERMKLKRGGEAWLELNKDGALLCEEYAIDISADKITVSASCEQGVILALTALYVLAAKETALPLCTIKDAPKYGYRGLSLDCVRHFFSAQEVMRIVEQVSRTRMNVLRWRLSDDQGWRIECESFPRLNEISKDYYTKAEIKEVVEYARVRGVEIIPEIDLPGHSSAILAAYPELSCFGKEVELANSGGIYSTILCAGKERVYSFLETLFDEICPLFPAKRFHIGGDEAPKKEWNACPDCQKALKEQKLEDMNSLQGYFTLRVCEILKKHGKQAICWNELLKSAVLPEDVVIQYWNVDGAQSMQEYIEGGGKFIYSDMFELYLDYPISMTPVNKMYKMKPVIDRMPCAERCEMLGIECCVWTEYISEPVKLEDRLFPRTFAAADKAWGGEYSGYREFCRGLEKLQALAEADGIHCAERERWDLKGKNRRKETIEYMAEMSSGMSEERRAETLESAKPSKAFINNFVKKFFNPADLPFLAKYLLGK